MTSDKDVRASQLGPSYHRDSQAVISSLNTETPERKSSNIDSIEKIFVDPDFKKMDDWDTDAFAREMNSSVDDESLQLSWKSYEGTIVHIDEGSVINGSYQEKGQLIINDHYRGEKVTSSVVNGSVENY